MQLDITNQEHWQQAYNRVLQKWGGLQILVNNAGVAFIATIETVTIEQFRLANAVMNEGVFLGCRAAIPAMKLRGGGSIINVSSIDGLQSKNSLAAYSSTKWAVRGMTKAAALEMGKFNIRVNSVHPG